MADAAGATGIAADGEAAGQARDGAGDLIADLLGLRDELAAAAALVVALVMACRGLDLARAERGALAELGSIARDRLDAVVAALDALISRCAAP